MSKTVLIDGIWRLEHEGSIRYRCKFWFNIADEEYDQVSYVQLNCNYCLILKDLF